MKRRAVTFALGCATSAVLAVSLRPHRHAAQFFPPIDLEHQVPRRFGPWQIDASLIPVLPNPEVQARLDQIYTQVLARTYVDDKGRRVMLSIAYGADQGSEATAAHRPEFCYSAQGFDVTTVGEAVVLVASRRITLRRLVGTLSGRIEPISYWVTLNETAVLPGIRRKLGQLRLGLAGQIPDGMLVRVSNIGPDLDAGFALHPEFLAALSDGMSPAIRNRYFGDTKA